MAESKKGRGCFFYGCLGVVILGVAVAAIVGFGAYFGFKTIVRNYTSPKGIAVAPVTLPEKQGDAAVKRVQDFTKALENKQPVAPLELTGDELDYVVRNSKDGTPMRDAMHMVITNDELHADLSLPLEVFTPRLAGRFLNGRANAGLHLKNGAVAVDLKSIEINGQPAPREFIMSLEKQGIEWRPKPTDPGAALVNNLQDIEIKDGKIILTPKMTAQPPPAATDPANNPAPAK